MAARAVKFFSRQFVGVNYDYHKMLILKLPAAVVNDANAPVARSMSGTGLREGLLQGPADLTVTPDGCIPVLEQGNARMLGYGWQASGQGLSTCGQPSTGGGRHYAFQNIGLLHPQAAFKFPTCGFLLPSGLS